MQNFWCYIPATVLISLCALILSRRLFHIFQLESYQFHGYRKSVLRLFKRAWLPFIIFGIVAAAALFCIDTFILKETAGKEWLISGAAFAAVAVFTLYIHNSDRNRTEKKKLVYTARMKRLCAIHDVIVLVIQIIVLLVIGVPFAFYCFFIALLPLILMLSALIAKPIEKIIFSMYFNDAKKRLLENKRLIRIGITGSYGKTSTKVILAQILSTKFKVLATPASFNTPMGVTRIIRERLDISHQVFIGEMGARHVGEIKELCDLVNPQIGILTSVGPQHLDTFRTLDRIKNTKYELIESLPDDGFAVFSDDGAIVSDLYKKTTSPASILVGKEGSGAWADEIRVGNSGSSFTLHIVGKEPVRCETCLLGEHNIRNIVVSAAVADHLGVDMKHIAMGIASLKPVEHRLQLLKSAGGITVIDDAFNTNPRSSKAALEVLGMFEGRKILVTPGMVELGDKEAEYNREFGRNICGNADVVFLVGKKHTAPIREGMTDGGFDENAIHSVSSLNEAIEQMNQMLQSGDVVMYENDLPDHYSEN